MLVKAFILLLALSFSVSSFSADKRARVYKEVMPEFKPYARCVASNAARFGVNEVFLLAVLLQERGPIAGKLSNKNGSYDYGVTGINTVREQEIRRVGLSLYDVGTNPCAAIKATAYLLSVEIKMASSVMTGIGNYHYDEKGKYPHNHYRYRNEVSSKIEKITNIILN
jgi:hypothetical protein